MWVEKVCESLQVYLGRMFGKDCAVKTICEGTRKEQARFLREIRILETLRTEHVVKYMGWSVCPEGLVMLMEYCPGNWPSWHPVFLRKTGLRFQSDKETRVGCITSTDTRWCDADHCASPRSSTTVWSVPSFVCWQLDRQCINGSA